MKKIYLLFSFACVGFSLPQTEGSEMAQLMRTMLNFLKSEKQALAKNEPKQAFPILFEKIEKATLTEGKTLSENHSAMRDSFFLSLNAYYKANNSNERKFAFNSLVSNCLNCHEQECPGPIPAIKKQKVD